MELRLHRIWKWVAPPWNGRIGGPAQPLELQATDTLEAFVNGEWVPVPVVEDPVPENPQEVRRRREEAERSARMQEQMKTLLANCDFSLPMKKSG